MNFKPSLLDVNVLLALALENHVHHAPARRWLKENAAHGIRTCPITEAGFIRIASNPKAIPWAVSPAQAIELIAALARLPHHEFWPDSLPLSVLQGNQRVFGHRQVTDAYLIAVARHHGGHLATFDRGIPQLAGDAADVRIIPLH